MRAVYAAFGASVLVAITAITASGALSSPTPSPTRSLTNRDRETFSVTYTVEITADDPETARVQWDLSGIDEIERIRLRYDPARLDDFEGSGTLERRHGELQWRPSGPYARLRYRVALVRRRAETKGFDSFATRDWVVTRTSTLFPRTSVLYRPASDSTVESRARLVFRLPPGWRSVTAMPEESPRTFIVESRGRMDHPRGWLALGRFDRIEATAADVAVTVASVGAMKVPASEVLALIRQGLPLMTTLFARPVPKLLIVRAPDPMWRGGLSGEESFFMHGDRPLRTPDRTSPYLHELFHVLAPFRPAPDAQWVTEGLAEFYSLDIQRRIGRVDTKDVTRAVRLFARYGLWNVDFTKERSSRIHNNSAPLVMFVLDARIRAVTDGVRGLDQVVGLLAHEGGVVSTARFLGAVERVAGTSFTRFFRDHVYRGEQPLPGSLP